MSVVVFGQLLRAEASRRWVRWFAILATLAAVLAAVAREVTTSPPLGFTASFTSFVADLLLAAMAASCVVTAELVGASREQRMLDSLLLSGVRPRRVVGASWAVGVALGWLSATVGVVVFVLARLGMGLTGLVSSGILTSRRGSIDYPLDALMIAVGCLSGAGLGVFIASYVRTAAGAAVSAAVIMAVLEALSHLYSLVEILNAVWTVSPLGASYQLSQLKPFDRVDLRAGLAASAIYVVVLPILGTARISDQLVVRATAETTRNRTRSHSWPGLASVGAGLLVLGLVVPVALRDLLPWYLSPAWLQQTNAHQNSQDVAVRFVDAVRQGRDDPSTHVPGTRASALMGPFIGYVRRASTVDVRVTQATFANPGEALVTPAHGPPFDLCLDFRGGRWLVVSLRSSSGCPTPRFP